MIINFFVPFFSTMKGNSKICSILLTNATDSANVVLNTEVKKKTNQPFISLSFDSFRSQELNSAK